MEVLQAWGKILLGHPPSLSIEITRECPLRCPGCYAYGEDHLGGGVVLRQLRDYEGQSLIDGVIRLVDEHRPLHVSLVGGEPLVRYRELSQLLPRLASRGIHTQLVTSAVRPIPLEWRSIPRLSIVVSIDGLQPEHDARRKPATYERILNHIQGHQITVHCTITRQMTQRSGYLSDFLKFWSGRQEVQKIWMSLFTPQKGESREEVLPTSVRTAVIDQLSELRQQYGKLALSKGLLDVYRRPPRNPGECIFAMASLTVSADLRRRITPCQFGGNPDCSQCGCIASAGLGALGRHKWLFGVELGRIYAISRCIGKTVHSLRDAFRLPAHKKDTPVTALGSNSESQAHLGV
jgi:sulfatase maturation enzyme AslB (radical SAM superfamily)